MGAYANVKSKQFIRLLRKLENKCDIELGAGGNHPYVVTCIHTGNSYPIPSSHKEINRHVIKDFGKWLVANGVCTKEDYDALL